MKRTGKKGMSGVAMFLVSMAVALFLGFVLLSIIESTGTSSKKVTAAYIESLTSDYDADQINDFYDKSPCVAGEDKVIGSDGKEYFYFGPVISTGNNDEDTTCDFKSYNNAIPDTRALWKYPDLMGRDDISSLKKIRDVSLDKDVCVLEDKTCAKWLENFYEELREE